MGDFQTLFVFLISIVLVLITEKVSEIHTRANPDSVPFFGVN